MQLRQPKNMVKVTQVFLQCGTVHILLRISITLLLSAYLGCKYSGYDTFILVLEVDCISNLSPNHTLQLTTLRTAMSKSLQRAFG